MKYLLSIGLMFLILSIHSVAADITISNPNLALEISNANVSFSSASSFTSISSDGTTLTFGLNNSTAKINSTADIALSNISYNNDLLSLTVYGIGGRLNFTNLMNGSSSNYYLKSDGTFIETQISNSSGWITSNRTITGTRVLTWGLRNVTFSSPAVSPAAANQFNTVSVSTTITDNDGGIISAAQAEVTKPDATKQNYSMSCVGALCLLSLADTGSTGTYTVTHFYATDSSGASYSSAANLPFTIGQVQAGGSPGGGGGLPGDSLSSSLTNISSAVTNITNNLNIPSIKPPSGQVGGMFWWLMLTLGSIMTVLSLSSKKASGNLLFIGLGIAVLSAYMLQLIPPLALKLGI